MRINRYIASTGLTSRRKAEDLVRAGRISVNGRQVKDLSFQVGENDRVQFDGKVLRLEEERCFYLFHKPAQVLCSRKDPEGRTLVYDYFPPTPRLFTVGRLDYDSEGLILLTNMGKLAHRLAHPSHEVQKEYMVWLDRPLQKEDVHRFLSVVSYKGENYQLDDLSFVSFAEANTWKEELEDWPPRGEEGRLLRVFLHEGKKREIRRIFKASGYQVERLIRLQQGPWSLRGLKTGEYRSLTPEEKSLLSEFSQKQGLVSPS